MKNTAFILILCAGALLAACGEEGDCLSVTTNVAKIRFYDKDNNERDTVIIGKLTVVGSDTILLADTSLHSITLPLQYLGSENTFVFKTEYGTDTLTLSYITHTRLISEDCGLETLFTDLRATRNDFDSISFVYDILVENSNEDIKIFN